ncbi:hypothetical protein DL93DRAFT_290139 [Clavulina sp. PMI_390]|nr:hypothetical protein DL93DRAFT_290139 [Clavulina sp. PMI_390]
MNNQTSNVSFPDGDLILRSSDNVEFRVDSLVLRRCSTFFNDLSALPRTANALTQAPLKLDMSESGTTLNAVLRAAYSLIPPPELKTHKEGLDFMIAIDKLQMSNYTIERVIDIFLSGLHALRAWALAVRFRRAEARMRACRQVITGGLNVFSSMEEIQELDTVSARAVARLEKIGANATKLAQEIAGKTDWSCGSWIHGGFSDFTITQLKEWRKDPWKGEQITSNIIAGMNRAGVCSDCIRAFVSYQTTALPKIDKILDSAVREEAEAATHI